MEPFFFKFGEQDDVGIVSSVKMTVTRNNVSQGLLREGSNYNQMFIFFSQM